MLKINKSAAIKVDMIRVPNSYFEYTFENRKRENKRQKEAYYISKVYDS